MPETVKVSGRKPGENLASVSLFRCHAFEDVNHGFALRHFHSIGRHSIFASGINSSGPTLTAEPSTGGRCDIELVAVRRRFTIPLLLLQQSRPTRGRPNPGAVGSKRYADPATLDAGRHGVGAATLQRVPPRRVAT